MRWQSGVTIPAAIVRSWPAFECSLCGMSVDCLVEVSGEMNWRQMRESVRRRSVERFQRK